MYHTKSVGVLFWAISHSSEASVSSPAWFNARIAIAVSLTFPQWSDFFLSSNSSTQSSKMLSGVARIVNAISSFDSVEQSSAFSSKHSNPFSMSSLSSCESEVDVVVDVVSSSVVSSSIVASGSAIHSLLSSSHISPVSQSPKDWHGSPSAANAGAIDNKRTNRTTNAPAFFMYR